MGTLDSQSEDFTKQVSEHQIDTIIFFFPNNKVLSQSSRKGKGVPLYSIADNFIRKNAIRSKGKCGSMFWV